MDLKKLTQSATPKKLGAYLARNKVMGHHPHGADGSAETVRRAEHDGHRIVIRTAYTVEVDGKAIRAPLGVDSSGKVHCHSLPNYQTTSAVDMVKALIDNYPDDFTKAPRRSKPAPTKATTSRKKSHKH